MKNLEVRKIIALGSFAVMAVVALYCMVMGIEISTSILGVVTLFSGYVGYYFGKSTALDVPSSMDSDRKDDAE